MWLIVWEKFRFHLMFRTFFSNGLRWNLKNLSRGLNPPKSAKTRFKWSARRLKSWNIWYHFKWNQPYLNRGLNLNRRSNSLNSPTGQNKLCKMDDFFQENIHPWSLHRIVPCLPSFYVFSQFNETRLFFFVCQQGEHFSPILFFFIVDSK